MKRLPDWTIPVLGAIVVLVLVVALQVEGDGRTVGDRASEVAGARYLLHETSLAPRSTEIYATLTSLDPVAITTAEMRR